MAEPAAPPPGEPSGEPPVPVDPPAPAAEDLGHVHFIGIGGAGMSGIARIMAARGLTVSGSDAKDSRTLTALRALGVGVSVGHAPANVAGAQTVVYSTAIRPDNPELAAARAAGARLLPRAAALAAVMTGRRGIAVAGTHGKTTTTSMLTVALQGCGADPSYAIGGDLNESGSNAHHGTGELFVAEADESDGSFLMLAPSAAIVTNVEADHLDHYADLQAVREAFGAFVQRVQPGGFVVLCADDPGARALSVVAYRHGVRVVTYGESDDADVRVTGAQTGPRGAGHVVRLGRRLGDLALAVPGRHNVLNATGALAAALELGFPFGELVTALAGFTGARRRFEPKGSAQGVRVVDDYAHHPTEVRAVLAAARAVADGGRLVVAFQPHRYSRTAAFAAELGAALGLADSVVVMEVYGAGEPPVPGVTGALVAAHVPLPPEQVAFEPSWTAVPGLVAERAAPGDLVLTLGAGDVTMLGPEVLAVLAAGGLPRLATAPDGETEARPGPPA